MSPKFERIDLEDGSFVDGAVEKVPPDFWRPHGLKYRLAWVQNDSCRVLFDNHHGKGDHFHIDGKEYEYVFVSLDQLIFDFSETIRKLRRRE